MPVIIAYFVHGRGRGHSSRALYVIKKLILRKYKLKVFAGRDAYPVLNEHYQTQLVSSIFPQSSFLDFIKRVIHDYKLLRKIKPDVVISDGDAPSTWAARLLGIHILSIGHALVFPYCKHAIPLSRWELAKENFKVRVSSQFSNFKFILHFCKLPLKDKKSILVKPDITIDSGTTPSKKYLISYFRDANGSTVLKLFANHGVEIRNFGAPVNIKGIQNFKLDNSLFKQMLPNAEGVISSSGSNIIFESMALKKPMLLLYKTNDFEQKANAQYMAYLNMGLSASFDTVSPALVLQFLKHLKGSPITNNSFNVMPSLSDEVLSYLQVNFE